MTDPVPNQPSSVLLLGPDGPDTEQVCAKLLSVAEPADTHLLSVTFEGNPDECLDVWQAHNGQLPAKAGVIDVGGVTRSAAAASPSGPGPSPVSIDSIEDPSDLTQLSIAISRYLDAWADADATPIVEFHSLSTLLTQVDQQRVYQFLHEIIGRIRGAGAYAHYRMDPTVHDEATINRFSALFDAVVRVEDDGSVSVQRRR